MKAFPVYFNGKDYWISVTGRIFDFDAGNEITNTFSLEERAKLVAVCWIGNIDLPISYKDGNRLNVSRNNIGYQINNLYKINSDTLEINGYKFHKLQEYKYYYVSDSGIFYSEFYNRFLHKKISNSPYYTKISLVNNNGIRDTRAIHRVIYYTLHGISENPLMEINHIDGRPWNNVIDNLEETTTLQNVRHSMFITKTHSVTWNPDEIDLICRMLDSGKSIAEVYINKWISNKISISGFKVLAHHLIHHTKFWVDISSNYTFSKWKNRNQLYTDDDVRTICELLEKGISQTEIANITGISLKYISSIKNRNVRKTISNTYSF